MDNDANTNDNISDELPERFNMMEKVRLYEIIHDLVYIVRILMESSSAQIDTETLNKSRSIMTKMSKWLLTEINFGKECMELMNMDEDELMKFLGDLTKEQDLS